MWRLQYGHSKRLIIIFVIKLSGIYCTSKMQCTAEKKTCVNEKCKISSNLTKKGTKKENKKECLNQNKTSGMTFDWSFSSLLLLFSSHLEMLNLFSRMTKTCVTCICERERKKRDTECVIFVFNSTVCITDLDVRKLVKLCFGGLVLSSSQFLLLIL